MSGCFLTSLKAINQSCQHWKKINVRSCSKGHQPFPCSVSFGNPGFLNSFQCFAIFTRFWGYRCIFFEGRLWIVSCKIPNSWSFFRFQREARVLSTGPNLTLGHLWPSHKQNPAPELERTRVWIWVELFRKKKAKWLKNNPVPSPCSDDAGWIIHCKLFIPRTRLAFMLNTLLASFDFLFHYSLCSVPLKLQPPHFWKSLFRVWEKEHLGNNLQLVLIWYSKYLPGKGQPGS